MASDIVDEFCQCCGDAAPRPGLCPGCGAAGCDITSEQECRQPLETREMRLYGMPIPEEYRDIVEAITIGTDGTIGIKFPETCAVQCSPGTEGFGHGDMLVTPVACDAFFLFVRKLS